MIIGFVGFAGCGKDTCADYLVSRHGFLRDSFAAPLKDAVSAVFGWDRELLEGRTPESRRWREEVDVWWAEELGIPDCSPRWILQHWGTDLVRDRFNQQMWILSLKRRLVSHKRHGRNVVITDVRFPNEIRMIEEAGGVVVRVESAFQPEWLSVASSAALQKDEASIQLMRQHYHIHSSEWAWLETPPKNVLRNTSTLEVLHEQLDRLFQDLKVAHDLFTP